MTSSEQASWSGKIAQPKLWAAEQCRKNDIPTPRVYATLADAIFRNRECSMEANGLWIRSEHPDELSGAAGLFESLHIPNADELGHYLYLLLQDIPFDKREPLINLIDGDQENNELAQNLDPVKYEYPQLTLVARLSLMALLSPSSKQDAIEECLRLMNRKCIERYCDFHGYNTDEFLGECSFTYWEAIPGCNRTVIADSARRDMYHVFSRGPGMDNRQYVRFDTNEGKVVNAVGTLDTEYDVDRSLIDFYERMRSVFGREHCWVAEIQTPPPAKEKKSSQQKHLALQVHKSRDFHEGEPADLQANLNSGEIQAEDVRGAIPGTLHCDLIDLSQIKKNRSIDACLSIDAGERMTLRDQLTIMEAASRSIKVLIRGRSITSVSVGTRDHDIVSALVNPTVTIASPEFARIAAERFRGGETSIPISVQANGRQAVLSFRSQ